MIRLLLSLLALVSGLALTGAPAQARLCAGHDTQLNAPAALAARSAARVAVPGIVQRAPVAPAIGSTQHPPRAQIAARPGVLIGIDRARQ